jgi:anti-sigma-K factor RskA
LVDANVALQHMENARKGDRAELERLRPIVEFLRQAETRVVTFGESAKQPPRGRVLVNPSRGVVLMAANLPALPAGRTFQMWLIPKGAGSTPRPAGLFQAVDGVAVHLQTGAVTADNAAAVAVSIEPSEGSAAPTTTPILVAPIPAL